MRPPRFKTRDYAFVAFAFLLISAFLLWQSPRHRSYSLRMTGGDAAGRRHTLAQLLARHARERDLRITVTPTAGSVEAFEKVRTGELDIALIQGGQIPAPGVMQVAALPVEPLHLLVKRSLLAGNLRGLRGKRLNLSAVGSGTRRLALQTLSFAGLEPGRDFYDESLSYSELEKLGYDRLPDGVFMVSTMPSPVADLLVRRHDYRFLALPFGAALSLRDVTIVPATIPAYAYGADPSVPERDVPTVGNRLLLIANEKTPYEAIYRLLETLYASSFARDANLPALNKQDEKGVSEMPLHSGAIAYQERNAPALTLDAVQELESLRSFLVSAAIGLFLLWRWLRRRRYAGFDAYIAEMQGIERQALALEMQPHLDLTELLRIRVRLSELKTEALEKFAHGELKGEELMSAFLIHAADVRGFLTSLILSERSRIARRSSDEVSDAMQEARFESQWDEAVGAVRGEMANETPSAPISQDGGRLP